MIQIYELDVTRQLLKKVYHDLQKENYRAISTNTSLNIRYI